MMIFIKTLKENVVHFVRFGGSWRFDQQFHQLHLDLL